MGAAFCPSTEPPVTAVKAAAKSAITVLLI
jgi:hypothetical protein